MMKPDIFQQVLLQRIQHHCIALDGLSPALGTRLMLACYRDNRAEGCWVDDERDMLLFQWGTHNFGEGESFQFDLIRQFVTGEDDVLSQLALTFHYKPIARLRVLGAGNEWCDSPSRLAVFAGFIARHAAAQAVAFLPTTHVTLAYSLV